MSASAQKKSKKIYLCYKFITKSYIFSDFLGGNVLMFSFSDHSDFVFHNKNMKILLMVYGMVTLKSKYIVLQGVSFFGYHYQKG